MKTNVSLACSLYQSAAATVRAPARAAACIVYVSYYTVYYYSCFFFVLFFIFFSFVRLNIFFVFSYFFVQLCTLKKCMYPCTRVRAFFVSTRRVSLFKACAPFTCFPFLFISSAFSPRYNLFTHL